ncbi:MAG: CHAD domain-containing protein [Acidimicrobiales bacterium]
MAGGPAPQEQQPASDALTVVGPDFDMPDGDWLAHPTAGSVLHRVLAASARTFLLNDLDAELADEPESCESVDSLSIRPGSRPLWTQAAATAPEQSRRRRTETERVHQSRIAMRRIRSNLRTFRLLVDPGWGTALRAELAWYGRNLGRWRDLHVMRDIVVGQGPGAIDPYEILHIESVIAARLEVVTGDIAALRGGARRFQLTEQMMVLWDGPDFKPKAERPAEDVLPAMLRRSWNDLRGAARTARKDASDTNLHAVRIRSKNLRYGCETVALIHGGPARKTARAAEHLQVKLGELLDAAASIAWFEDLAHERPDLAEPLSRLVRLQRDAAVTAHKGWKREVKEVERRWRRWHA